MSPAGVRALARLALRDPAEVAGLAWTWLRGKRLRARQRYIALAGARSDLRLPPAWRRALEGPAEPLPAIVAVCAPEDAGDALEPGVAVVVLKPRNHDLAPGAIAAITRAFADPGIQALYGDAAARTSSGLRAILRPAFDPDFLTAFDYAGPVIAIRANLAGDDRSDASAVLRRIADAHPGSVRHLPGILSLGPDTAPGPVRECPAAVPAGPAPLVSVIVPTRDRLDLLETCIGSLRRSTDWPALEILVVDNDSREPATLAYLRRLAAEGAARVVPWPGAFDFAGMNNAAAAAARGALLAFVNNDVEAFRPDWLRRMAEHALRPDVGAVGAKLLDAEGRIQHGGIVLGTGGGMATHAFRFFPGDADGDLMRLRATHRVSAVTAACLVVEARKFAAVGGFDAENFAVDFNDVDLCLRLDAAGHRTLMVPGAMLHHREAASRRWTPEARARHEGEVARLRARWPNALGEDPRYHPGFDPDLGTYVRLRPAPPVRAAAR